MNLQTPWQLAERLVQGFPQAVSNKSSQALAALRLLEFRANSRMVFQTKRA